MSTDTDVLSFSYEPVDASEIPSRPRPMSPGRPSTNPHGDRVKNLAGTEDASAFRVPLDASADDKEVKKIIDRHTRWLRTAAHDNERGVRVWHKRLPETNELKIYFKDIAYIRRPRLRLPADSQPSLFEGNPETDSPVYN